MNDHMWHKVCTIEELEENWGEVALIEGRQYAIFRLTGDRIFATDHADPNSGALVIARGITGQKGDVPTIASPLYKEEYDLRTGESLNSDFHLPVYETRIEKSEVLISVPVSS